MRGALHQQEMQAELAADKARAEQQRRVKARPLPVSLDKPVVPTKPEPKPATLFNLKGEVRVCHTAPGTSFEPVVRSCGGLLLLAALLPCREPPRNCC